MRVCDGGGQTYLIILDTLSLGVTSAQSVGCVCDVVASSNATERVNDMKAM